MQQVCECAFALHQEQKTDHLGAEAIDVHRMFHHDSTALITRASGLGRTSAGLPHIQQVRRNLRLNPVDPNSPLQKLTHTITTRVVSCILNSTDVWFCPPQCGLYSFRAQHKAECLGLADPGISRVLTDLYPLRGYTPRNTRDRSITRSLRS